VNVNNKIIITIIIIKHLFSICYFQSLVIYVLIPKSLAKYRFSASIQTKTIKQAQGENKQKEAESMAVICIYTQIPKIHIYQFRNRSRDSAVGIATSYLLDDRAVAVRVTVGARIFSSPRRPDRLWGPPNPYPMCTGGCFPGGKAAGA
jgi:hypothetical protein